MKRKEEKEKIRDGEEEAATRELRALEATDAGRDSQLPSNAYWATLIVRTNERLDAATSGKAISLSWVFRVAVPGVVAILFFFIGLHYYLPEKPVTKGSVQSVITSLPEAVFDSVLADPSRLHESLSIADLEENVFDVSNDQIREYFLQAGDTQTVLESLTDEQLSDVLTTLDQKKNHRM